MRPITLFPIDNGGTNRKTCVSFRHGEKGGPETKRNSNPFSIQSHGFLSAKQKRYWDRVIAYHGDGMTMANNGVTPVAEIRKAYLNLFSQKHDDPKAVTELHRLGTQASEAGLLLWKRIIEARIARGERRYKDALSILDSILAEHPDNCDVLLLKGLILGNNFSRYSDAIDVYDALVGRFGGSLDPQDMHCCAMGLNRKGVSLAQLGESEAATETFAKVVERYGESPELPLREQGAQGLFNKGVALGRVEELEEAIVAYREVVKRYGESPELTLRVQTAGALCNMAAALNQMGRAQEAIATCDEVVRRYGDSPEQALREQVAGALNNRGVTLSRMGMAQEAIATCDEVVSRCGEPSSPRLREVMARAQVTRGSALARLGREQDAIALYDDVLRQCGESPEAALQEVAARALLNKGLSLDRLGKAEEAIAAWDEVVRQCAESPEVPLKEQVASALFNKGVTFGQLGRAEEAIAAYDEAVRRYGDSPELALRENVAKTLFNKGGTFGQLGRAEEAIAAYDEVVRRYGDSPESALREEVASAMFNKAVTLSQTERPHDALKLTGDLVAQFGGDNSPTIRDILYRGLSLQIQLLALQGSPADAQAKESAFRYAPEYEANLSLYLKYVLAHFDKEKQTEYFTKMKRSKEITDEFIFAESLFEPAASLLLVLREWNSYTPALPTREEADRGGGYFVRFRGHGIVIDPGYDFIQNFYEAGGRLTDIDHIIITHAHDDHTADLESLLMLLYRRSCKIDSTKRVCLYLNEGAQRKFSGILPLRDSIQLSRVTTLSRPAAGCFQKIRVADCITLTVLAAHHDDVITSDSAVGLGFEFRLNETDCRQVVFTGDTGLYPHLLKPDGIPQFYDPREKERPKLDTSDGMGLYSKYPKEFQNPDLVVAHIGSIREEEFVCPENVKPLKTSPTHGDEEIPGKGREEGEWYYPDHLGLLGTMAMLDQLKPNAAIISEFGAEMKDIKVDLVGRLERALHDKQEREQSNRQRTRVIPGDVTIVYDIDNDAFLCHNTCKFESLANLDVKQTKDWKVTMDPETKGLNCVTGQHLRPHLISSSLFADANLPDSVSTYYKSLYAKTLCYFQSCSQRGEASRK